MITVGFGQPDLSIDENGNRVEVPPEVALVLQRIPPGSSSTNRIGCASGPTRISIRNSRPNCAKASPIF